MKILLSIIALFYFTSTITAQLPGTITDWNFFALKGKVATLTIKQFKAERSGNGEIQLGAYMMHPNGRIANKGDMQDSLVFNENGFLNESFYFPYAFNDIKFFIREKYYYDKARRVTEKNVLSVTSSVSHIRKETMVYNASGRLSDLYQTFDTASAPAYHYVYSYPGDPLVFNAKSYAASAGLLKYYTYQLDSLTRLISVTDYNKDSIKNFTTPLPLNERFYIQRENNTSKTGDFNQYAYDEMGNWVMMVSFSNNVPTYIITRSISYYN